MTTPSSLPLDASPTTNLQQHFVRFTAHVGVATVVTAAFGSAFAQLFSEPALAGAGKMLLMAETGWILLLLIARATLPMNQRMPYEARLGQLMRNGVLFLIPITAWVLLGNRGALEIQLALVSVSFSFSYMLFQHFRICLQTGLKPTWTLLWMGSLLGTAAGWFTLLCDVSMLF